ncbi:DsbA family protein [Curtobacterium sp. NPDC090217]|uniref:DsbA family protein n=1 Tax=Curtobacterium sp. NPDC090217 TaxID=3363970 RepID=UPI00381615F0
MTNRPEGDARAERNQRRAAARERAQRARLQQKRRQRGLRLGLQIGLGVVLLAAVTVVTLVLVDSTKPAGPGPSSMSQGGITIGQDLKAVSASTSPQPSATDGADTVRITMYVDYNCAECADFVQTNNAYIRGLVESGAATVDIHPVATLSNRSQGTKYSLRAANAAACVAESSPDQFFAVNKALFAAQPEEGTAGLTDAQLTKVVTGVSGVQSGSTITKCIDEQRYGKWVDERTTAVTGGDIPGSDLTEWPGVPLVLVNGQRYEYSQPFTNDEFRTFVITAAGSGDATPTPTPSASPSASAS